MKLIVVIVLGLCLLFLIRKNLLQVDMTFPLFLGIVLLGFASMSDTFIHWVAAGLGIIVGPNAIILIAITLLLALVTVLAIAYSHLRRRQIMLVRYLARLQLDTEKGLRSQ